MMAVLFLSLSLLAISCGAALGEYTLTVTVKEQKAAGSDEYVNSVDAKVTFTYTVDGKTKSPVDMTEDSNPGVVMFSFNAGKDFSRNGTIRVEKEGFVTQDNIEVTFNKTTGAGSKTVTLDRVQN